MPIELIVDSHSEADQVIAAADKHIKQYTHLSVADLYEMVGELGNFNDTKVGWTDVEHVTVDRTTDGLSTLLTFPEPSPIYL